MHQMTGVAAGPRTRLKSFADRHGWLGPAIWMASILYFVDQIFVGWVWHPPYSFIKNTISDLGNTACGQYGGSYVCSPRNLWMNAGFVGLGLVMFTGSFLLHQEFADRERRERLASFFGFSCLGLGGLGVILVGTRPENTVRILHMTGAGLAIGVGNLGILLVALGVRLPARLRGHSILSSLVSLVALLLFACDRYFGLGAGGMERIAAYPETIWMIWFGIYISRDHYVKRNVEGAGSDQKGGSPGGLASASPQGLVVSAALHPTSTEPPVSEADQPGINTGLVPTALKSEGNTSSGSTFGLWLKRPGIILSIVVFLLLGGFLTVAIVFIMRPMSYGQNSEMVWYAGETVAITAVAVSVALIGAVFAIPSFLEWRAELRGPKPTLEVSVADGTAETPAFRAWDEANPMDVQRPGGRSPLIRLEITNPAMPRNVPVRNGQVALMVENIAQVQGVDATLLC
jgi:hypothetical membrane protein